MDTLAIDIETYSDVSLPDCGVHRYAASEQFEILLFAYSLNAVSYTHLTLPTNSLV